MARIKNPTTSVEMGRSRIVSPSKDTLTDNGTVLVSLVHGEQLQMQLQTLWFTNLTGCTITAKIIEGDNDGSGTVPTNILVGGVSTCLVVIDDDVTDNIFSVVLPEDLISSWAVTPGPDKPVYGFFGLEIADSGTGDRQQIYKPMRGLVEVLYSPSEG